MSSLHDYKEVALDKQDPRTKESNGKSRAETKQRTTTFSFFGHFGLGNFGNESTLQAMLDEVRRLLPEVEIKCICTGPAATAKVHNIPTVPVSTAIQGSKPRNRVLRAFRSIFIGLPRELYRWLEAFHMLKGTDVLIVPGTGLLTDAFGLGGWGPYSLFKWTLTAKMRGCKVVFVSVGAGPMYTRSGRLLTRWALALADFRSYRDYASKDFLSSIGAAVVNDRVYPDLAWSIVNQIPRPSAIPKRQRAIIGLGLMLYHRKLSTDGGRGSTYTAYLEQLVLFTNWLLAHDYDVRLLIGEVSDRPVVAEFKELLRNRLQNYDESRIIDEPVSSVEDLLAQLAATDVVVATRFHNILLALALNKPVVSISFHQKCTSLMQNMGLQEYCQDIKQLNAARLIEQFSQLEENADCLRTMIRDKEADCRAALDEQYRLVFEDILGQTFVEGSSRAASVSTQR